MNTQVVLITGHSRGPESSRITGANLSLADGVLFEFGPSRQQDLALRDQIRRWQPQLRTFS
jgi:hypothetical protein